MAHKRIVTYPLPKVPLIIDGESTRLWMEGITRVISTIVSVLQRPEIVSYLLADLPDPTDRNKGEVIFVSNATAGQQFKGSDGSNWRNLG